MLKASSPLDARKRIISLLKSLIPESVRSAVRDVVQERKRWICEKSSEWMSFNLLYWLVGPVERINVDVPVDNSSGLETWQSGVKLKECRYLVEVGCKSACLNLCKVPTQTLFNEEFNMPLYMKPNFEDCSCEFLFGISPPTEESDPAFSEACYTTCYKFTKEAKR